MDVRDRSPLPGPPHPGYVLQHVLQRYQIPQLELARAIGVKPTNLCKVVGEKRPVTIHLGRRLAMALGTRKEFWLERQLVWDLAHAEDLPPVELARQLARFSESRPPFWLERELALELGLTWGDQPSAAPSAHGHAHRNGLYLRREHPDRAAERSFRPNHSVARRRPRTEWAG
jgi:addiction module HigA family antidote